MRGKLKIDEKIFVDMVQKSISSILTDRIKKIGIPTRQRVGEIIKRELSASVTVKSLLSGQLKDDFGLTDRRASLAVDSIISIMSDNIDIKTKTTEKETLVLIQLLPISPDSIAAIVGGEFKSYRDGKESGIVKWAEWLITRGTEIVISDHAVVFSPPRRGRSGGSYLMKKNAGVFRVDPEHSGTTEDNFITRAISPHAKEIAQIILEEIARN